MSELRRRMMMAQAEQDGVRHEIELSHADDAICIIDFPGIAYGKGKFRNYFKANDGLAIAAVCNFEGHWVQPILVATTNSAAESYLYYENNPEHSISNVYPFEYKGKTYWATSNASANNTWYGIEIINPILYLNDVTGVESYPSITDAQKALIDYYGGEL